MDWKVADSANSTRHSAAGFFALAVVLATAATVCGQEPSATAPAGSPVADARPQASGRTDDAGPPPASGGHQPSPAAAARASYTELPEIGEFSYEAAPCDGLPTAFGGCDCGRPDCCPHPLRLPRPSACGYWLSGEYLLWSISGDSVPPLVTASPAGTLPEETGVIGNAGTRILAGGDSDDRTRSGYRIAGGWWLDAAQTEGIEVSYAGLPGKSDRAAFASEDFPRLARPVIDALAGAESAMLVAHPDFLAGEIAVRSESEFHLAGVVRRNRISQSRCQTVDTLFGFRFAALDEQLRIEQSSEFTVGQGPVIEGTTLDLFDRFETENRFYGVLLGLDIRNRIGAWTLSTRGSLSMGNHRAEVMIDGATITSVPGDDPATAVGGLLAQQTNIGSYTRDRFSLMPELSVGLSRQLNRCWQFHVGYHLLYTTNAARPGRQIDRRVSQLPPEPPAGADPSFQFDTHGVLIHGLQTGLQYRF